MDTLQSMFPNVEYETLEIVLESQEGDLEAAIEAMLEMVKDSEPSGSGGGDRRVEESAAFEGPPAVHPIIERDTQIRTDEMIARRMQEQIISEALQEQTPTCFTPITGMLSGGGSGPYGQAQGLPSSRHPQEEYTLANTVGSVWNYVSSTAQQVTQSIVNTASTLMSPEEEADDEPAQATNTQETTYMEEEATQAVRRTGAAATTTQGEMHRRKPQHRSQKSRDSKKAD